MNTDQSHEPADFEHAFEYLEWIEMNHENVNWNLLKATDAGVLYGLTANTPNALNR